MLQKIHAWVATEKRHVRHGHWSTKEIEFLNTQLLLTAKPVVFLVNLNVEDYIRKRNKWCVRALAGA